MKQNTQRIKRIKVDSSNFGEQLSKHFDTKVIQETANALSDDGDEIQFMFDLETLGKPQEGLAPIVSLSLLAFNKTMIIDELSFYIRIDMHCYDELMAKGVDVKTNMDTIMWWMGQSDEARKEFKGGDTHVLDALMFVKHFIAHIDMWSSTRGTVVWAKSPDFDMSLANMWLIELTKEYTRIVPYNVYRCVRTVVDDAIHVYKKIDSVPSFKHMVAHNPSDDCVMQINTLWYCWDKVNATVI